MITNLEEAARIFQMVDNKFLPGFMTESILNYIDFHITPLEIQLVFLKEPYLPAKELLLEYFSEFSDDVAIAESLQGHRK